MADKKPLVLNASGDIQQIQTGDTIPLANGGTGATTASGARTNLALVPGTDVQAYSLYLTNEAALGTAGIVVKNGTTAYARTMTGASADARITVTNGNGVSGDPTFDLTTVTQGGAGSFLKVTIDSYGRITGNTAVVAGDISALVDSRYLQLSGGTLTNFLTLHADPSSAMHAVTKQYADSIASGLSVWKDPVRGASTAVIAITGRTATTLTVGGTSFVQDGVTYANNDRFLVKDSTSGSGSGTHDNGIYTVSGVGSSIVLTRSADANTSEELKPGLTVWVNEGTINSDTSWTITGDSAITVGTTAVTFSQTGGVTSILAGNGLVKTGNIIDINADTTNDFQFSSDQFQLKDIITAQSSGAWKFSVDTTGRITATTAMTAADIGAQAADSDLTALAGLAATGMIVRTGTGTATTRSVTSTGNTLTVTNGNGVSGDINVELKSGVVAPGTYYSQIVDTYGRVVGGSTTPTTFNSRTSLTSAEVGTTAKFKAVYAHTVSGQFKMANSNAVGTTRVIGLTAAAINAAASGEIITSGSVSGTTGEWDAVTGQSGGLTPGAVYFLSNSTAGNWTTTVPSTGYLLSIGIALSNTEMLLQVGEPVQL